MTSFKYRVEQSSIGTRQGQAARSTVTTRAAAAIIIKSTQSTKNSAKNTSKEVGGK